MTLENDEHRCQRCDEEISWTVSAPGVAERRSCPARPGSGAAAGPGRCAGRRAVSSPSRRPGRRRRGPGCRSRSARSAWSAPRRAGQTATTEMSSGTRRPPARNSSSTRRRTSSLCTTRAVMPGSAASMSARHSRTPAGPGSHGCASVRRPSSADGLGEAGQEPVGVAGAAPVDGRRRADQRDPPVPVPGQVPQAPRRPRPRSRGRRRRCPAGSVGRPISTDGCLSLPQRRDAQVVALDVHHDQGVDHGAVGDPFQPGRALVLGQQQHVVVVGAGGGDDRGGELHDDRHVDVHPQRHDQRQHVGLGAGQRAGAGVRVEAQLGDGGLDPGPGLRPRSAGGR